MSPGDTQFRFLIEHIREEMGSLKEDLNEEFKRHDNVIEKFMEDTAARLKLMEEQVLSIQKFKWMALGITSFVLVAVELIVTLGQNHV